MKRKVLIVIGVRPFLHHEMYLSSSSSPNITVLLCIGIVIISLQPSLAGRSYDNIENESCIGFRCPSHSQPKGVLCKMLMAHITFYPYFLISPISSIVITIIVVCGNYMEYHYIPRLLLGYSKTLSSNIHSKITILVQPI